jgi:hypothetical protein
VPRRPRRLTDGPSPRRRAASVAAALLGLVASGCVDKTPPALWPSPPPPPMATPIGVPERVAAPVTAASEAQEAQSEPEEAAAEGPVSVEAPASPAASPPEQPDALGPWQPGQTNR